MQTADKQFDYSVWFVLDKIRDRTLPNKSEVSYPFDINIKRINPITYWNEKRGIDYLITEGVIEENDKRGFEENDKEGTPDYSATEVYHLKVKRKFFSFYDRYCLKVYPTESKKYTKLRKQMLQDLIDNKFSGDYEIKLLKILSKDDKTASEIKTETSVGNVYHLISDVRKKLINEVFEIVSIKSGNFKEYKKYRLVIS